jgi:hypothetical protein
MGLLRKVLYLNKNLNTKRPKYSTNSVADPDPGSGAFLTAGSGMNKPDHISEGLETIFWLKILKFFDADPGSEMRDPGWKKFGSGIRINIPDPQHWVPI